MNTFMGDLPAARILYTNYKGEIAWRLIRPIRLYRGTAPPWYPEVGWLLLAFDEGKRENRTFAMKNVQRWEDAVGAAGPGAPTIPLPDVPPERPAN